MPRPRTVYLKVFLIIGQQLWKLEGTAVKNRANNKWTSNEDWNLKPYDKEYVIIEIPSTNEVLSVKPIEQSVRFNLGGRPESSLTKIVIKESISENSSGERQLWIKGKEDTKGYFSLKHVQSGKLLTATASNDLQIRGNLKLSQCTYHLYKIG